MLCKEVTIIKAGAQTKGDNTQAKGNALTDHYARTDRPH